MLRKMTEKLTGKIVEWNAERGFGFLQCGTNRVFLHHREFSEHRKKIGVGDRVLFLMGTDAQGRHCAKEAAHVGNGGRVRLSHFLLIGALIILPAVAMIRYPVQWNYVGGYLLGVNAITFLIYFADKSKARKQTRRVPEARLHLLELLGGWPAAFLSQRILRHKTSKISYQIVFWLIVAAYQITAWDVINGGAWTRQMQHKASQWMQSHGK